MMKIKKQSHGFSLIELLVAMLVGLFILGGVFSLFSATRNTQKVNEAQMDMSADARFAIEMIAYDLRHAGVWGGTNRDGLIECRSSDAACAGSGDAMPAGTNACGGGWYNNLSQAVFATDDTVANPYAASCINAAEKQKANTDILEIRYADSNVPVGGLIANQAYVRSNFASGKLFVGATAPVVSAYDAAAITQNYTLHAYAYYISTFTDTDGQDAQDSTGSYSIPSLRRVALVNGPEMQNQLLISGVVDLQVQFGEDTVGNDQVVDQYVNPQNVTDFNKVYAVKIWLVLQSDKRQKGLDTTKIFNIANAPKTFGGVDGFRHFMVSTVVNLRNLKQ